MTRRRKRAKGGRIGCAGMHVSAACRQCVGSASAASVPAASVPVVCRRCAGGVSAVCRRCAGGVSTPLVPDGLRQRPEHRQQRAVTSRHQVEVEVGRLRYVHRQGVARVDGDEVLQLRLGDEPAR